MSEKKLILKDPIKLGDLTISELAFIQPKAKHLRNMPQNPSVGDLLDFAGRICGQSNAIMGELSIPDMNAVMDLVSGFLDSGPQTGNKP